MKVILIFLLLSCANLSFGQMNSYKLPDTWDKNFVISTQSTHVKRGGSVNVRFTYDSGTYTSSTTHDPNLKNKAFALTQADRDAILMKLRELKIESIKSPSTPPKPVESTLVVCLGTTCIDGGSASTLNETDQTIFRAAYRFINDFAINK